MQLVSSRIWTRVAVSNSYDDNHYSTGTPVMERVSDPYTRDKVIVVGKGHVDPQFKSELMLFVFYIALKRYASKYSPFT